VFNCQSCPDTYGACGYPTCSSYTCGNAYSNGVYCAYNGYNNGATNYYCSNGACLCTSSSYTSSPDGKDNNCNGTKDEAICTRGSVSNNFGCNLDCANAGWDKCECYADYGGCVNCVHHAAGCGYPPCGGTCWCFNLRYY